MKVDEEAVRWAYRALLGRRPESAPVIDYWIENVADLPALVEALIASPEFMGRSRQAGVVSYVNEEIVSFAQNTEDVLFYRAFRGKADGVFMDIGAGHPIADSVTTWLSMKGWRGVNIEPNPRFFADLELYRPTDINLNIGVGDVEGDLTYYRVIQNELGHGWGLSSFDPSAELLAKQHGYDVERLTIPVTTLPQIAEQHAPGGVDILKIDVEGYEEPILRSTDWRKFRPRLICIEAVRPNTSIPCWSDWEHHLLGNGYVHAQFDGANCYYVCEESPDVLAQLSAPVNCNDRYRRANADDIRAVAEPFEKSAASP